MSIHPALFPRNGDSEYIIKCILECIAWKHMTSHCIEIKYKRINEENIVSRNHKGTPMKEKNYTYRVWMSSRCHCSYTRIIF